MTTSVNIVHPNGITSPYVVNDAAKEAIRLKFNPSGLKNVEDLKALAGAFLSLCDQIASEKPDAGRELAVAKTNMQTASMWAVLGATKGF
jgi:hypothetical protein